MKETTRQAGRTGDRQAQGNAGAGYRPGRVGDFDSLEKDLTEFRSDVDQAIAIARSAGPVRRLRSSAPTAAAVDKLVDEALAVAAKVEEAAAQDAEATITQAARVGFGIGLFVVMVLIGAAAFGRSVDREADRPDRAGSAHARRRQQGGRYSLHERGDEVGDAARAANTFRDNLMRMEKMEAEQKEAEARLAAERKTAEERDSSREEIRRGARGSRTQGGDAQARRRIRGCGRDHHRNGVVRLDPARGRGRYVDQDRGQHPAARRCRCGRFGGSVRQRPVGRLRYRRDDLVGRRDQPAGAVIERNRRRGGEAGR